jgi:type II secretory pathway pseudopilin PulG
MLAPSSNKINFKVNMFLHSKPKTQNPSTPLGQTLVEVIVAIGIIIIVLVAVFTLAGTTIRMGTISRQKLQAVNLAQEGIEAIRNIRDSNWIQIQKGKSGVSWDNGPDGNKDHIFNNQEGVIYNNTEEKWEFNRDPNPKPDYFDANYNRLPSSTNAVFTRIIDIDDNPDPGKEKKRITVTVSWARGSQDIVLKEDITNWQD